MKVKEPIQNSLIFYFILFSFTISIYKINYSLTTFTHYFYLFLFINISLRREEINDKNV